MAGVRVGWQNLASLFREREEVAITATCCLTNNKPHSRLVCHETI
jgi:hypothetical protein